MSSIKKKSLKQNKKGIKVKINHDKSDAVFRIKGIDNSTGMIKHIGIISDQEKLGDEIVELDKVMHSEPELFGKNAIPIEKIGEYDMVGRLYRSNIVGSFIVHKTEYPFMFLTTEYTRSIASGSLLQLYISIKMNDETKKEINKNKKYARYKNLRFNGKWNRSVDCDPEMREMWKEKITEVLKEEAIEEFHRDYMTNEEKQKLSEEDTVQWIKNHIAENIAWYEDLMEEQTFQYRTVRRTRDYLIDVAQDQRFHKLLKIAIDCRAINRRREHNIDDNAFEIPDPSKVIKMSDIEKEMIENNELITSYSSDGSDDLDDLDDSNELDNTDKL